MLHTASNQAIELSAQNSYKYVKMDNHSDNDEIALCEPNRRNNKETNLKPNRKSRINLKRILIISLICITLALLLIATIGAILIFERPANYRGHKVYKLIPASVDDLNAIIRLEKKFQVMHEIAIYIQ